MSQKIQLRNLMRAGLITLLAGLSFETAQAQEMQIVSVQQIINCDQGYTMFRYADKSYAIYKYDCKSKIVGALIETGTYSEEEGLAVFYSLAGLPPTP